MVGVGRLKTILLLAAVLAATVGCAHESHDPASPAPTTSASEATARHEVGAVGLSFELPASFQVVEDPDLLFVARSAAPPAVVSVDRDTPTVFEHVPEEDESLTPVKVDGVKAVMITNAVVEGLPPGVTARELSVRNGDRSFTVIFSAADADLGPLWERFLGSVRIAKAEKGRRLG